MQNGNSVSSTAIDSLEDANLEPWELTARECIRDLVARYNANGDSGRFEEVLALFSPDAEIELADETFRGRDAIRALFERTAERTKSADHALPGLLRHFTATHQIDLRDESTATGRSYFVVFTSEGPDHWGRYLDDYRRVEKTWLFAKRRVLIDARAATSLFSDRAIGRQEERP